MLRCAARDEGRSRAYDAEERNKADGHFSRKPEGAHLSGRSVRKLAKGIDHWLRFLSRIPSREAYAATPWSSSTAC